MRLETTEAPFHQFRLPKAALAALVVLAIGAARDAVGQANVSSIGDISPVDNPFIINDQGIPSDGNTILTFNVDVDGNPVDPITGDPAVDEDGAERGQDNYERSVNIEIGRYATGQMLMSGGAALRFGDLIIGGDTTENFQANNLDVVAGDFGLGSVSGSGTVEIAGDRTVYNNHPLIIETQYQDPANPEATTFNVPVQYNPDPLDGGIEGGSDTIVSIARPDTVNVVGGSNGGDGEFDLYVGLTGNGLMRIVEGGRAEIRDGAFIGVAPNAVGRVVVDGERSYLGIYGMNNPFSMSEVEGEETLIGLYGDGTLEITNGARVDSFNRAALGATNGAGEFEGEAAFERGGNGSVIVDGVGSTWRVFVGDNSSDDDEGSALAIGEYYQEGDQSSRIDRIFSEPEAYRADDGKGTLTIRNGGLVTALEGSPSSGPPDNDSDIEDASVRIGLYGVVQLTGGRLDVANRLDNDGLIRTGDSLGGIDRYGDGEINAASFLNSPLGQVRVRASEYLLFRSDADDGTTAPQDLTAGTVSTTYYLANAGKIEVLGDQAIGKAEIEFSRDHDLSQNGTPEDDRFKNLFLPGVAVGEDMSDPPMPILDSVVGQIFAQDANLFFRSGLLNDGDLSFVGGDNNLVGRTENSATGFISITNESHVTFQDRVVNDGIILLNDESDVTFSGGLAGAGALIDLNPAAISVLGSFQTDGALDFVIGGGANGLDFTRLGIVGDAAFGMDSTISIDALSLTGVVEGATYELISMSGGLITDDGLTTISLPAAPAGLFFIPDFNLLDGDYTLTVGSFSSLPNPIVGADFNGDGLVDDADLAIWEMNFGLMSGATAANGDADGDGDVDAFDFFILNGQLGGPPVPFPGGGSGASEFVSEFVPEPSALLLLLAGSLGLGMTRRRD